MRKIENECINDHHHIVWVSVIKGICIILMVLGHSGCPEWLRNSIYLFHMPCFFILSGVLFKINRPYVYIKKKVKGLYLPFITYGFIFIFLHNIFFNLGILRVEWEFSEMIIKTIETIAFIPSVPLLGPLWFLSRLFLVAVICYGLIYFYHKLEFKTLFLLLMSIFLLLLALIISLLSTIFPVVGKITLQGCSFFIFGYLLRTMLESGRIVLFNKHYIQLVTFICLFPILGLFLSLDMGTASGIEVLLIYCTGIMGFYTLINLYMVIRRCKHLIILFDYIGKHTLEILVFHLLSFKIVSLIIGVLFNIDADLLWYAGGNYCRDSNFWIIFVFMGIILSLIIGFVANKVRLFQINITNYC